MDSLIIYINAIAARRAGISLTECLWRNLTPLHAIQLRNADKINKHAQRRALMRRSWRKQRLFSRAPIGLWHSVHATKWYLRCDKLRRIVYFNIIFGANNSRNPQHTAGMQPVSTSCQSPWIRYTYACVSVYATYHHQFQIVIRQRSDAVICHRR